MFRYWKKRRYYSKPLTKQEKFAWVVAFAVFIISFFFYFTINFISNCVFEWPLRWDIKTCWKEQIEPSNQKASEKTAPFI
jgi:hypothetical protein